MTTSTPLKKTCQFCTVFANVKTFYWPETNPRTACLDLVERDMKDIGYGATTGMALNGPETYFGCSVSDPALSQAYYLTTAVLRNISTVTVKVPVEDPWSPVQYITSEDYESSAPSARVPTLSAGSLNSHMKAHSLMAPRTTSHTSVLLGSTTVLGSHTLWVHRGEESCCCRLI